MSTETEERVITDFMGRIDRGNPDTLAFRISDYQKFDHDRAVVTILYANVANQGLGIVIWNLEPGQENDYHVHPSTEHLHIILAGQAEYSLGDRPPVTVGVGQAVMVPANIAHGIRNVGTERCSYMAINSPGDYQKIIMERPA